MTSSRNRLALFIAVPVMLLLLPLSIYFVDSAAASDKVSRNVSIEGVDVSRYTEEEAAAVVDTHADSLASSVVIVDVNGEQFELDPADVGIEFERTEALQRAMSENKDGLSGWLRAFSTEVDVPVNGHIDKTMLNKLIRGWESEAIPNPAFDGAVVITSQRAAAEYPHGGVAVDRDAAFELISAATTDGTNGTVVLPIVDSEPTLTDADIDEATEKAQGIIDRGIVLTNEEYGFEFIVNSFNTARALSVEVVNGKPSTIEFTLDPDIIGELAEAQRANLEVAPIDATWDIVLVDDTEPWDENYEITDSPQEGVEGLPANDTITLVPSKMGTSLNVDLVVAAVQEAALGDGTGELELEFTREPDFTTEDAEAYGELYEVSEFTTYKPGVNRAHNIDLMADTVDGHVVMPGETFSVNEFIGRRTLEKGYLYDCAIVSGELSCEEEQVNVGGGVSQFGTTIFNAIFFGCYKDIEHQPHSIYFTKYPEGREATLGFPSPDVAFENDTDAPVIIKTSHTPRSITVTFFGNNGGIICGSERSERSNVASPVTSYQTDPEVFVAPGEEKVKTKGSKGWSVTVTRTFKDANGNQVREPEAFFWRYRGEKNVILVHPCDPRAGGNGKCPSPVPSVVGLSEGDAVAAIKAAGYPNVVVTYADVPGPKGLVVNQSHNGGYPDVDSKISITVDNSDDPPPPPPDE
jgi:vancomycin resistance protein YoaR